MAKDINTHLEDVLSTHKLEHIKATIEKYSTRKKEVIDLLVSHYSSEMYTPFQSGSMAKHTAVNNKFDFDIVTPFKRDSFSSLEEMFNSVYNYLVESLPSDVEIRKQKVSIGITYPEDKDGIKVQLDVVPGREINVKEFSSTHNLHLYVNEDIWGFAKGTHTKTNIHAQIDHIKGQKSARKIIRLLKIWKNHRSENFKSFMLELFTIKALTGYTGASDIWSQLQHVIDYISEKVVDENFKLIDPGNSNNNVLATMDVTQRNNLSTKLNSIKSNISSNADIFLDYYFPIREEYKQKEKRDSGYGQGNISYPPTSQRFG